MLIASSFHDYYDRITAYGIDKTVVYQRDTQEIKIDFEDVPAPSIEEYGLNGFSAAKFVIGFCGVFFPVIRVRFGKEPPSYFYTAQELLEFLKTAKIEPEKQGRSRWFVLSERYSLRNARDIERFYDPKNFQKLEGIFQEWKTPVFAYGRGYREGQNQYRRILTLNPQLSDLKFAKVKDPATAFQEIYMYISGVLGVPPRPTIEISDKDKQAAKGHDGAYSFKKPPGGGRWR